MDHSTAVEEAHCTCDLVCGDEDGREVGNPAQVAALRTQPALVHCVLEAAAIAVLLQTHTADEKC